MNPGLIFFVHDGERRKPHAYLSLEVSNTLGSFRLFEDKLESYTHKYTDKLTQTLSLPPSLSHTHTHKHIHTEKERKRVCALSLVKGLYPGWKQTSIHLLLIPHKRHETANSFKMHKISFDTNIIKTCEVERLQSFIVLTFFSFPCTTATDPAEPGSWHYIRQRARGSLWPLYSSPSPRRLQGGHRHSTPAGS